MHRVTIFKKKNRGTLLENTGDARDGMGRSREREAHLSPED
jgi:hypothetical protein